MRIASIAYSRKTRIDRDIGRQGSRDSGFWEAGVTGRVLRNLECNLPAPVWGYRFAKVQDATPVNEREHDSSHSGQQAKAHTADAVPMHNARCRWVGGGGTSTPRGQTQRCTGRAGIRRCGRWGESLIHTKTDRRKRNLGGRSRTHWAVIALLLLPSHLPLLKADECFLVRLFRMFL